MDPTIAVVMRSVTSSSDEERITFPAVISQLMAAGVERYHTDLCRWEKTYFLPGGESLVVPCARVDAALARHFSQSEVEAAIRMSQSGQIKYREFCRHVLAAGCVGYLVSIAGRRVAYYGRSAEMHVEHFPQS